MVVFRELVTRLSFSLDRTNLDRFERSIVGFKTKFALGAAALTAFASKTLNYFDEIAKASQDTRSLADQTGIAVERFVALRKAAQDFQLDPKQFDAYFKRLSALLRQAESGRGELFEIIRKSKGELNLTPFIKSHNVEGALKAVLHYVSTLEKIPDRVNAISDVLGENNPNGLLRIINAGSEAFNQATEKNKIFGESFLESEKELDEYTKKLRDFYNVLELIKNATVKHAVPIVTDLLENAVKSFEGFKIIGDKGKEAGFGSIINFIEDAVKDNFNKSKGEDHLTKLISQEEQELANFRRQAESEKMRLGLIPANITTNIEVNVNSDIPDPERREIAQAIKEEMEDFWEEKTREVINNNPQSE